MAFNPQFKINQMAKDMGLKSKEMTDLLAAKGMTDVKSQKALSEQEFNVLFQSLTEANQVDNIYDYMDGKTCIPSKIAEARAAERAAARAKAEEEARMAAEKAAREAAEAAAREAAERAAAAEKAAKEAAARAEQEAREAAARKEADRKAFERAALEKAAAEAREKALAKKAAEAAAREAAMQSKAPVEKKPVEKVAEKPAPSPAPAARPARPTQAESSDRPITRTADRAPQASRNDRFANAPRPTDRPQGGAGSTRPGDRGDRRRRMIATIAAGAMIVVWIAVWIAEITCRTHRASISRCRPSCAVRPPRAVWSKPSPVVRPAWSIPA